MSSGVAVDLASHADYMLMPLQMQSSMVRMIQVWDERRVFGGSGVKPFMDAINGTAKPGIACAFVIFKISPHRHAFAQSDLFKLKNGLSISR